MEDSQKILKDRGEFAGDLHTEEMMLNIGPSHPATHGTVRLLAKLDGETVVDSDTEIGYLHRAFEKCCEAGRWEQAFPYTDRLNYNSALANNVAYAMAVEKLIGVEMTERCQFIRTIICELARIADHLTCVGPNAMELGAFTAFMYLVEGREMIWDLFDKICGARLTNNYVRIGGLKNDLPEDFSEQLSGVFKQVRKLRDDTHKLLTRNRIFVDRMRGTGIISQEEAVDLGFTGPLLRATGIPHDLRSAEPYLVYDRLDFDIPAGSAGDNYDKYLVRMEEILQSMRIVEQCMKMMPGGPVNVDDPRVIRPSKDQLYLKMEEMIDHFKLVYEGVRVPKGEAYAAIESPNGELGFYLVSDGTGRPVKVRCRPPSFVLMAGLDRMLKGGMIADIVATFGMMNMIGGECDR